MRVQQPQLQCTANKHHMQVPVLDVQRSEQGAVLHIVEGSSPRQPPVAEGAPVEVALDWGRRLDHMQMHSGELGCALEGCETSRAVCPDHAHRAGQHLLSAVADVLFGAQTTSWEMRPVRGEPGVSADAACVDLDVKRLSQQQVQVSRMHAAARLHPTHKLTPARRRSLRTAATRRSGLHAP